MDNYRLISETVKSVIENVLCIHNLNLETARKISEKVREEAKRIGVNAVVALSDNSARPVLIECMDDAYIASYDIALNKAYTAVSLKMSTSALKPLAQPGNSLYGIQFTNEGKIVIFGGGEPLEANGKIAGGLGVSGGSEEQDTYLAQYGKKVFLELINKKGAF